MVNTNIQSPISLIGRGKVYRTFDTYRPGEYKELKNCEAVDELLTVRRPIKSLFSSAYAPITSITDPQSWVGHVEGRAIVISKTQQFAHTQTASNAGGNNLVLWAPTSLPVPLPTATSFHVIRGVFKYNNRYYWLTHEYDSDDTAFLIDLLFFPKIK